MSRDDIIRMAREAGAGVMTTLSSPPGIAAAEFRGLSLERFAALVAAAEREACAKVCEQQITGHHFLAIHGHWDHMDQASVNGAAAIRARSQP